MDPPKPVGAGAAGGQLDGAERATARGLSPSVRGSAARSRGDNRRTAAAGSGGLPLFTTSTLRRLREETAPSPNGRIKREDFVYNPLHCLELLEHKIGALDQAAPLVGWDLPEEFATLRRLIEARMAKRGKREFVQVLRLLEVFRPEDVLAGVREAIARGAIGFDAVKHLVLCRIERRPPRLDLTVYPYLPRARVATTSAKAYLDLLAEPAL